jgi:hypothetical protein
MPPTRKPERNEETDFRPARDGRSHRQRGAEGVGRGFKATVSFAKKPRPFETPHSRLPLPRAFPFALVRTILLGLLVVALAAWALVRHYSRTLPPMRIPMPPAAAPTYDPDGGELPVPELIESDGS